MKPSSILALPAGLIGLIYAQHVDDAHTYSEQLHLQPLPGGALYAGFNFTATTPLTAYERQHFRFFPRSLGQILQFTHTAELHLRFAAGRWDADSWGSRPRQGSREGGTGVELWGWIEGEDDSQAMERWSALVNSLSGLFCASLNFIDSTRTISPLLAFDREGFVSPSTTPLHLMHGMLPHEVVCTENLTPFLKLLPCKGKAGLSTLLDGHKVFDANWQAMAVHVKTVCPPEGEVGECALQMDQTLDMVLDIDRSMRPKHDPIPRPPPVEEMSCDDSKSYHSHDTCHPRHREGEMEWSISRVFGRPIHGSCDLSSSQQESAHIFLDVPDDRVIQVSTQEFTNGTDREYHLTDARHFRLGQSLDIHLPQQLLPPTPPSPSLLDISRQITGYGQERGGMHTLITNPHPHPLRIIYLESLPWFLRPYMHTLRVSGATIETMFYTPAIDRKKGTHLELLLSLPAHTTISLTYDFEKAVLRYTEYPPDANRGFDVPPAIIRVLKDDTHGMEGGYMRTTSLLLPLPTPDFSMPYNVIILTSTVIALGFGSIFNLLVRRFVLGDEVPGSVLGGVVGRLRGLVLGITKRGGSGGEGGKGG
ncbi:related to GPI transamidase component Gpi16 [Ramularia collo-cygni]|uniref:Related to GPI transamidase component Gpi16 n=1 Tax=Ramularia collo-cygni TaxID=112498 RepID=A0A2D3VJE5_9PEZI|nr:related to GPI transamidase component Gpi16 [Ramularia collo-cygni]CZT24511.1 related to GPI transamidase component Gpi16 [Ramularia collo-cygni]